MNRFVSLLLVALSLAAVSLARPAQAQWVKGQPYYDPSNSAPTQAGNTTITTTPVGTIKVTSTPPGYPNTASGNFSGNAVVRYTWTGSASTRTSGFSGTDGFSVSGSDTTAGGSAASNAGNSQQAGVSGSTTGTPNRTYSSGSSGAFVFIFMAGDTSTTATRSVQLQASTAGSYMGSATANAAVTFGDPAASP